MVNNSNNIKLNSNLTLPKTDEIIWDLYQENESKKQKEVKGQSWLEKGHPLGETLSIDWELGSILLGDGHIKGTPFEGYSHADSIKFFHQFTTKLLEKAKSDPAFDFVNPYAELLQSFTDSMHEAQAITTLIGEVMAQGSLKEDEREQLLDAAAEKLLLNFREKKSGWIPCGWTTKNGDSHGMMAHVDMKKGGVTIVNTGAGITKHHPIISVTSKDPLTGKVKEEIKAQEFVTYTTVDRTKLRDKAFFRFFLELQVRPQWEGNLQFDEDNIYKPLNKYLKGKKQKGLSPFTCPEAYKKPQRSGSCAIKSTSATLYYTLTESFKGGGENPQKTQECYKKIKYLWQTLALVKLGKQINQTMTESQRFLLEDLMENVCRSAEKLYGKAKLTDTDLFELKCTVNDIKERLSSITPINEDIEKTEEVNPAINEQLLLEGAYPVNVKAYNEDLLNIDPSEAVLLKDDSETPVESFIKTYLMELPKIKAEGTPKEKVQKITALLSEIESEEFMTSYNQLNKENKTGIRQELLNELGLFIANLPIPSKEKASYWSELPELEMTNAMEELIRLMNLLLEVRYLDSGSKLHSAETTVMQYALLTIVDQMACAHPETMLGQTPINYYELILEMRSPHFVIKDQQMQKTLTQIVNYFDPAFALDDLLKKEDPEVVKAKSNSLFAFKKNCDTGHDYTTGCFELKENSYKKDALAHCFDKLLDKIQKNPEDLKKLYERGLVWKKSSTGMKSRLLQPSDSKLDHLVALILDKDDKESLIPKSLRLLQHAAMLTSALHYAPNFDLKNFKDKNFSISVDITNEHPKTYNFSIHPLVKLTRSYKDLLADNLIKKHTESKLIQVMAERYKQNTLIAGQNLYFGEQLDISREIEMMGVEPYEEISRACAFIKKHVNLLKSKHIQAALQIHLFRFGRLDSQLQDEPAVCAELSKSIHHAIKHYLSMEDIETCLFLAKLGQDLKMYVSQSGIKLDLIDFGEFIQKQILPRYKEDLQVKVRCFETLVSFYENISPGDILQDGPLQAKVIHDVCTLSAYQTLSGNNGKAQAQSIPNGSPHTNFFQAFLHENSEDKAANSTVRGVQLKMLPVIEEGMKNPSFRNACLNELIKIIQPDAEDLAWEGTFPLFENESYSVNLKEGTIINKKVGEFTYLPQKIQQSAAFRKIFTGKIITCEKKEDGITYILNKDLPDELVVQMGNGGLKFQRTFQGMIYRYVATPAHLASKARTLVDSSVQCWVKNGEDSEMLLIKGDGKPFLVAQLKNVPDKMQHEIKKIYKYGGEEKVNADHIWIPFEKAPKAIQYLKHFEKDEGFIECWTLENTNDLTSLAEVKLPRLGLSFKVKKIADKERLYLEQYPGYFLAQNPNIPFLEKTPKFLTLQNLTGERKILLPKVTLTNSFEKAPFDKKINQEITENFSWIEYELKNDTISSRQIEGQLYQLAISLTKGDYHTASKLLEKLNPLDRFKDDKAANITERTILRNILEGLSQDPHPAAAALLLKIALVAYHNELKYPLPINAPKDEYLYTWEQIKNTYEKYFNNNANAPSIRLKEKEEREVLEQIYSIVEKGIEKANPDEKKILGNQKAQLDMLYGERRKYLNTKVAKLGARTFTSVPSMPKEKNVVSAYQLESMLKNSSHNNEKPFKFGLIQNEAFFASNFFNLYKIARHGDENQRKELCTLLEFSSFVDSEFYGIIKRVVKKPSNFPSLEEIDTLNRNVKKKFAAYSAKPTNYEEYSKAVQLKHDAFSKIAEPGTNPIIKIWKIVKQAFKLLASIFLGEFSLGTKLYEAFYQPFMETFQKTKTDKNIEEKISLPLISKGLKESDEAFDSYFDTLLHKYFEVKEVAVSTKKEALPVEHLDKNIAAKLNAENEELKAFYETLPKTEKVYALGEGATLSDLKAELEARAKQLEINLKTNKAALLWQLNDIPEQTEKHSLKEIRNTGFHHRLNWDELKAITLKGDLKTFKKKTSLKAEDAERLMVGVSDYLIKSSRKDQMQTVISCIEKYEKVKLENKDNLYLQSIPQAMRACRAYKPDTSNLAKQWFEAANHYHYREIQLRKLKEFTDPSYDEILGEAPTGFGKTKNVIPNLNYMKGEQGKLVVNTWPQSLEMQNAVDTKHQMSTSFGKKSDRIHFDRASDFTTESLQHLYKEMLSDMKKGVPINIRSEAFRSLQLHTLLLLKQAKVENGDQKELKLQISYLIKILRLIRTQSWTTVDEEHINLDPLDKLIYALGDPTILSSQEITLFEDLFKLLETGDFAKAFNISENQQSLISEEIYEKEIAPKIANFFIEKFKIPKENIESFLKFVLAKNGETPSWIENSPERRTIALLKGLLTQVLKSCIKGSVDENYGLSKEHIAKKEYAIPFLSANTPKETKPGPSQFKNPHETMAKTYLTYLHKGLSRDQMGKFIEYLKAQAIEEAKEGGSIEDTEANKFFKTLKTDSNKHLHTLTEKDLDGLMPDLAKNRSVLFYYIRYIIGPQLKIYQSSLISTVHNFRSQFPESLSLSATPQDKLTHGPNTHFVPMKGTSGQVTHLLLTKCKNPKTLHEIQSTKPAAALDEALEIAGKNPRIHATIDIGANFKGLSNLEVAEKICLKYKDSEEIQAVLFFDEKQGLFKIMDIATRQIHDSSEIKKDPKNIQTVFDQNRCFGSDTKQAADAIGILMTGKNTTKTGAGQGAGRMRDLPNGQSIEIGYPKAVKKDIFDDEEPEITKLLMYWIANDVKSSENKVYHSQLQQMDNELRSALFDKILGLKIQKKPQKNMDEPDVDRAIALTAEWESEFFTQESNDSWNMYAGIAEDKDAVDCLKKHQIRCLAKTEALKSLGSDERKYISDRLQVYPIKWDKMILPKKVKEHAAEIGMECEVLQEIEVETEVEIQAHVKEAIQRRTPSEWPKDLDLFDAGWEEPVKQNIVMKKIAQGLVGWFPENPIEKVFVGIAIGSAIGAVAAIAMLAASIAWPIVAAVSAAFLLLGLGYGIGACLHNNFSKSNPIFRVKDLMALHLPNNVSQASQVFNSKLLASNNFYVQKTVEATETPQSPLNVEQKPVFSLLVMMDEMGNGKKKTKVMVIDQNDSPYFHKKLKEDNEKTDRDAALRRTRKVGIYDIGTEMFTVQGKNRFDAEDMKHPDLLLLISQAKFLNGEINYKEEEVKLFIPHIEEVAKNVGHAPLQDLYEKYILQYHPKNRAFLKNKKNPKPIALALGL